MAPVRERLSGLAAALWEARRQRRAGTATAVQRSHGPPGPGTCLHEGPRESKGTKGDWISSHLPGLMAAAAATRERCQVLGKVGVKQSRKAGKDAGSRAEAASAGHQGALRLRVPGLQTAPGGDNSTRRGHPSSEGALSASSHIGLGWAKVEPTAEVGR